MKMMVLLYIFFQKEKVRKIADGFNIIKYRKI